MTWFDYAVLAVLGLSLLWSLMHGFVRELVSVAGWVAAFVLAMTFAQALAGLLPVSLGPFLAGLSAFLIIFIGVWVLSGLIGMILSKVVKAAGLGWADRMLGALFGLVRGLVIVLVMVMLGGLTPLPREPFWRDAVLSDPLETMVVLIKRALPEGLAERMRFGMRGAESRP
ncbi:MAG: CvpA family protein [Betaproteobacteria bacterium]|nr:CvpA family protein [Betaproteobacteria bacterium]